MLKAAAGDAFGPFTLLRPLSEQGVRQRWIVCRTDDTAREPFLLEILPGPLAEHRALPRPVREEMAHLRSFRHPRFTQPSRMALVKSHIGFSFQIPGVRTLEELLEAMVRQRIPMPVSAAVELALKIAEALDAFHRRRTDGRHPKAHLALRPAHVFLAPGGEIALASSWVAPVEDLWPWGPPRSALCYLAPERVRGEPGTPASDLYAVGRVLRACLTLRPARLEGPELILGYLQKEPEGPDLEPLVDTPLVQSLLGDLLSSDPTARPQSAADLTDALTRIRRAVGERPSLEAFVSSLGLGKHLERAPEVPIPTDGVSTEDFPAASQLRLAAELNIEPPVRPSVDEELEDNLTFEEPPQESEDPFASLEAALSDLEVTFADVEMPAEEVPEESRSGPRRSVRMGALRKRPHLPEKHLPHEDVEPSLTSVVVDISELLPDDAVKPLETGRDRRPLAWITLTQKDGGRQRYPLDGTPVTVGRSPSNTIHITGDGRVSRLHCRITMEDGEFVLEDAGSNNGTLVDGVFVKRQALRGGEEIIIGGTVLSFTAAERGKTLTPPF